MQYIVRAYYYIYIINLLHIYIYIYIYMTTEIKVTRVTY